MKYKRFNMLFLILIMFSILNIQPISSLSYVAYTFDELYTEADQVILGSVVNQREFLTHTLYEINVEKSYKNSFEHSTIQIKSEELFSDYPDYRTKLSEGQYLLFLIDTGSEYKQNKVFEVKGVIQGVFRIKDDIASNGIFNININGDEIRVADDGNIIFRSIIFPDNMTRYDFQEIKLKFYNEGGQRIAQNFNVSIIGSSDTSNGEKVTNLVRVAANAGRTGESKLELNMSKQGLYDIYVNDTHIESILIHESGYGARGYNFSNIRVELSNLEWSKFKIVFEVTSGYSEYNEVYYRMVVSNGKDEPRLNIPMKSEFEGTDTVTHWYSFGRNTMGTRKIVIWYKGLRVLETTIDLGTGESHSTESDLEKRENSIPGFSCLSLLIGIAIYRKHMTSFL